MKLISSVFIFLCFQHGFIFGQRDFVNPAITDPAPCSCDQRSNYCDPNCCCDGDCSNEDLAVSPVCRSARTTSSYSIPEETSQNVWNCSNGDASAAGYDFFPFVCIQLKMNEIIGRFHKTNNLPFVNDRTEADSLRSKFTSENAELFQSATVTTSRGRYTGVGSPILVDSSTVLQLPGNIGGISCQNQVPVLLGVNRDVTCTSSTITTNLCTYVNGITSILSTGVTGTTSTVSFFSANYAAPTTTTRADTQEYYLQDSPTASVTNFSPTDETILDYCDGAHPVDRVQRYDFCTGASVDTCNGIRQTITGCPVRSTLSYSNFASNFFDARTTSSDDAFNFAEFANAVAGQPIGCTGTTDIRRIYYRFRYSSFDNRITSVETFVLLGASSSNIRVTIEWNDIYNTTESTTTIPRGYQNDEVLLFRRNGLQSDVSTLVPTTTGGLCVDATREVLRYKQSTTSTCFVQLRRDTITDCHNLKLNMFIYLNTYFAPASHVLAHPGSAATLIEIRDYGQEARDLDIIDVTRPNNRLDEATIRRTRLRTLVQKIYDAAPNLGLCFNVPSGIYVEFGFIRVPISSTVSYERIVTTKLNFTYSNWKFDCTTATCNAASTQRFPVTFESAFVDYTNRALYRSDATRSDHRASDNYIEHILWLISSEYKGEPGFRNYTSAMILTFIAISLVVLHVVMFGWMLPF